MSDELHERLRNADPLPPAASVNHITGGDAHALLEEIMDTEHTPDRKPRAALLVAALGGVAAAILLVVALAGGSDDPTESTDPTEVAAAPLELRSPESDPTVMGSCVMLDPTTAADLELAFRATVVEVEGERALLDVDAWYRGGDAEQVAILSPQWEGMSVEDVDFVEGETFLVTANDGVVIPCFTDEATPELQALYDAAFAQG